MKQMETSQGSRVDVPSKQTFGQKILNKPKLNDKICIAKPEQKPKELTDKQRREHVKKLALKSILIDKGLRVSDSYLVEGYNASAFASKLLQKSCIAFVIPTINQALEIKVKAAVSLEYGQKYMERLCDMQKWFDRKVNFTKQTESEFFQRQSTLQRTLIKVKQQLKNKITNDQENEKFDNLLDTTAYNITSTLQPTVIIITQNAYRCLDFEQIFRDNSQMFTFFTRHYPIAAVVEMINQNAFINCKFIIGTTSRLLRLLQIGSLSICNLKHLILDCGYEDDNMQTPFEYDESRSDVRVFYQQVSSETKVWIL